MYMKKNNVVEMKKKSNPKPEERKITFEFHYEDLETVLVPFFGHLSVEANFDIDIKLKTNGVDDEFKLISCFVELNMDEFFSLHDYLLLVIEDLEETLEWFEENGLEGCVNPEFLQGNDTYDMTDYKLTITKSILDYLNPLYEELTEED